MEKEFVKPGRLPLVVRLFRHDAGLGMEVGRTGMCVYPDFFGETTEKPHALTTSVADLTFDAECDTLRVQGWEEKGNQ